MARQLELILHWVRAVQVVEVVVKVLQMVLLVVLVVLVEEGLSYAQLEI